MVKNGPASDGSMAMKQSISGPMAATLVFLTLLLGVAADLCAQESTTELPPPRRADDGELAAPKPPAPPQPPLRLADAIRQSLANVETVQANVAVQTATVARFDALKAFVPLINLPQLAVGFRQL